MSDPVMLSIFGVHVCPSRCDMYARSAIVSVLPPGIDVRKLQRSHSELSRVEQLSGLLSRLFVGLPTRFRGRSQLSTFMKAYTAYARGEGVWDHRTLFPENQHLIVITDNVL